MRLRWILPAIATLLLPASASAEMLSVKTATANFREGPSTKNQIIYSADKYYPVKIIARKSGWCKTKDFEGDIAWVSKDLLSPSRAVVINVPRANVRKGPNLSATVVFKADWGEALKVANVAGAWLNIRTLDGKAGWVHKDLVWGMKGVGGGKPKPAAGKGAKPKPKVGATAGAKTDDKTKTGKSGADTKAEPKKGASEKKATGTKPASPPPKAESKPGEGKSPKAQEKAKNEAKPKDAKKPEDTTKPKTEPLPKPKAEGPKPVENKAKPDESPSKG